MSIPSGPAFRDPPWPLPPSECAGRGLPQEAHCCGFGCGKESLRLQVGLPAGRECRLSCVPRWAGGAAPRCGRLCPARFSGNTGASLCV